MLDWKPSASLKNLQQRAQMLAKIRQFFALRDVLEVETPILARSTVSDLFIDSVTAEVSLNAKSSEHFLQTSPEYFMKRLLASGSGSIYQIAKAFRQDENGKRHNTEFTLLEWYRLSFTLEDLMTELEQLLQELFQCDPVPRFSYRELFQRYFRFDPHEIDSVTLYQLVQKEFDLNDIELSRTDCLQLLLAERIEAQLPAFCFIFNFPQEQAALSTLAKDETGVVVAKRFELFGHGMELANGYFELSDAREQRSRFEADNIRRKQRGLREHTVDEKLMAALSSGMPSCSGVALGVDRLLMLLTKASNIAEVISFDSDRV
jgi:elongation factor P--(R)-beta-lysine ligase